MKKLGRLGATDEACIQGSKTILAKPSTLSFSVPVLITMYDVCEDCGTFYAIQAELQEVPVQANMPKGNFMRPG